MPFKGAGASTGPGLFTWKSKGLCSRDWLKASPHTGHSTATGERDWPQLGQSRFIGLPEKGDPGSASTLVALPRHAEEMQVGLPALVLGEKGPAALQIRLRIRPIPAIGVD